MFQTLKDSCRRTEQRKGLRSWYRAVVRRCPGRGVRERLAEKATGAKTKGEEGALQGGLGRTFQVEGTALHGQQLPLQVSRQLRDQCDGVEVMRG